MNLFSTFIIVLLLVLLAPFTTAADQSFLDCEADELVVVISRVIDGDTVEYQCNDMKYKVRIIGIDTPEINNSQNSECFAEESAEKMREFVLQQPVVLEKGYGTSDKDKYGRLLRYVTSDDFDFDVGSEMISQGYAFSYKTYRHERTGDYNQAERKAKAADIGFWNKDNCDYDNDHDAKSQQADDQVALSFWDLFIQNFYSFIQRVW